MVVQFPQEIFDDFVDHLRSDMAALFACSLTCSALLDRSRMYKFASLSKFLPLDSPREESHYLYDHAAPYVRKLELASERRAFRAQAVNIQLVFDHYINLQEVKLQEVDLSDYRRGEAAPSFPRLKSLTLSSTVLHDHGHLTHFLCQFPNLHYLNMTLVHLKHGLTSPHDQFSCTKQLPYFGGHLEVTETSAGHCCLDGFLALPTGPHFKSLKLGFPVHEDRVMALLQKCGPELEDLHIVTIDDTRYVNLSHNTNLRFLRLPESHGSHALPTEYMLEILFTISSTSIFEVWIPLRSLTEQEWERLDEIFSEDTMFPNLERLVIGFPGMGKPPRARLPRTQERVVIEVCRSLPG